MKNSDDLFGGFFDFNGDGKTSWDEELLAYMIIDDIVGEDEQSDGEFGKGLFGGTPKPPKR